MPKISIRKAKVDDIGQCAKIYFEEFSKQDVHWSLRTARARVKQSILKDPKWCFVILHERKIIGVLLAERLDFVKGKSIQIQDIVIMVQYQNKGYGARLLRHLERSARKSNYKGIYLTGNTLGAAGKFYKKLGFLKTQYMFMGKEL
ncbi:MAG TPA: GNAT family N-acetyltransferase [archaeon]|nr:GNAT family N-acetyltransferase [archaeon]